MVSASFWDPRMHAAVAKGGSATSFSSAFQTPRVQLVRRYFYVELRPTANSWT